MSFKSNAMASIDKVGNKFRLRWTNEKHRSSLMFDTQDAAEYHKSKIESDKMAVRLGFQSIRPPEMMFNVLCREWLGTRAPQKRSAHHDKSVISFHLLPFFGSMPITRINNNIAIKYATAKNHLSKKTIHNHLTLLIAMLNWAHASGWIEVAPIIKKPKLTEIDIRYIKTKSEIKRLLQTSREFGERYVG